MELKFYTFEEWEKALKEVCKTYPKWLHIFTAGKSHDGRNIYEVRLGTHRNCIICSAGIHGREWVNPVILLHLIEEYAEAAEGMSGIEGYHFPELLKHVSFCFVPMVNPDGYVIATEGFEKIQNTCLRYAAKIQGLSFSHWKSNARGMDINRNFPGKSWYGGNGSWPSSELETKTLIQIFCSHPQSLGFLDFHSRGRILYYYRKGMGISYNRKAGKLAGKLSEVCGYRPGRPTEEFLTGKDGGNSVHYYAENFRRPAITVETVDEKEGFPIRETCLLGAYEEVRLLPLVCAEYLMAGK